MLHCLIHIHELSSHHKASLAQLDSSPTFFQEPTPGTTTIMNDRFNFHTRPPPYSSIKILHKPPPIKPKPSNHTITKIPLNSTHQPTNQPTKKLTYIILSYIKNNKSKNIIIITTNHAPPPPPKTPTHPLNPNKTPLHPTNLPINLYNSSNRPSTFPPFSKEASIDNMLLLVSCAIAIYWMVVGGFVSWA